MDTHPVLPRGISPRLALTLAYAKAGLSVEELYDHTEKACGCELSLLRAATAYAKAAAV